MGNNYYTYIWFNTDTFEIFYIGMGTGLRRFEIEKRNILFNRYYQNNNCAVRLYETGLSRDDARILEIELIAKYNPCCNLTRGGEYSNGKKISEVLKGRVLSEQHKKNLSNAGKKSWKHRKDIINNKQAVVLNEDRDVIKVFKAKYKIGEWLHTEYAIGKNARSAQRKVDSLFNTNILYNNQFYFFDNIDNVSEIKHN